MIMFFNASIAEKYGLPDTIVFEYFYKCCKESEEKKENYYYHTYWTKCSRKKLMTTFKFFKDGDIKGILKRLEAAGLVKTEKFLDDDTKRDHSKWYSITELGHQIVAETMDS